MAEKTIRELLEADPFDEDSLTDAERRRRADEVTSQLREEEFAEMRRYIDDALTAPPIELPVRIAKVMYLGIWVGIRLARKWAAEDGD